MKLTRQQLLLGVLILIGIVRVGDWVLQSLIQGPLQERKARTAQLQKDIRSREKQLADLRAAGGRIDSWLRQSLPADAETARTAYRSWLLGLLRKTQMTDAVVDSGSPGSRRLRNGSVLYRSLPFTLRARGSLPQFNNFLFQFTRAGLLHQITNFSLTPSGGTAIFDVSVSIDTVLLPTRKGNELNSQPGTLPALATVADYASIASQNIFAVGLNTVDPLKHTFVSRHHIQQRSASGMDYGTAVRQSDSYGPRRILQYRCDERIHCGSSCSGGGGGEQWSTPAAVAWQSTFGSQTADS